MFLHHHRRHPETSKNINLKTIISQQQASKPPQMERGTDCCFTAPPFELSRRGISAVSSLPPLFRKVSSFTGCFFVRRPDIFRLGIRRHDLSLKPHVRPLKFPVLRPNPNSSTSSVNCLNATIQFNSFLPQLTDCSNIYHRPW